ncbi:UNVERIFIED_CONTAM: hypothetical protein PYX00_007655 [Menopon gallinae]|uniref:THAP4-like heme-binding domain-containing protein n=1 Tax=Menopon gallinae TaxID=328185 RepID=A0AAW2HJU2_9NEOP
MASGDNVEVSTFRDHPIHEAVSPIIWLHGKWRAEDGRGVYTNVSPFTYAEEIQFSSYGQPGLNYSSVSWNPKKKMPMHLESGFLRIKPDTNELAFLVAHNFGLVTVEEGRVADQTIELDCDSILRMSFSNGPKVTKTRRTFTLTSDSVLEQVLYMETSNSPMTEHLRVVYRKID